MLLKMNLPLKKLYRYIVTILAFKKKVSLISTVNLICQNNCKWYQQNNEVFRHKQCYWTRWYLAKFVQMLANVIDCHLSNIITCDISKNKYSEHAKTATVRRIFKRDDRTKIKNYRPVSLLNMLSKIYKRVLHENLTNYVNTFLSKFILA